MHPYYRGGFDTTAQTTKALIQQSNGYIFRRIKSIRVTGISGVDSLISIYNEDGIKAACMFDDKKVYTLELCLPLKFLKISADAEPLLAYHIIINGYKSGPTFGQLTNTDGTPATSTAAQRLSDYFARKDADKTVQTDFWGEYTLAQKP